MRQNGLIKRVSLVLTACLVALLPAAGAQANGGHARTRGAAPPGLKIRHGKTQPKFSYAKAVRETIYIESDIDDDGKPGPDLLATDIIRPKETNGSLDVSTIYEMSPYYQNIHGSGAVQLGRGNEHEVKEEEDGDFIPEVFPLFYDNYFVPRGYAVMLQDMPGTRNSEGCMVLGGNGELAAAKATMAWLNGNGTAYRLDETTGLPGEEVDATWSNGKAGMIGKSYDGTISNAAASMGLKGLKTIVPIGGISRWYNYMFHNGVQYTGNASTAPLFTYYIDQPPADDEEAVGKWVTQTFGEHAACEAKGSAIAAEAANPTGDYTAFWDERDYMKDPAPLPENVNYASKVGKMKASVFIAHG
ncbi:MAG TPA: CocE/NonD family hydrolase, partial [Actinomycetota bacterium]|nr:CocE/NonD family hydrolase [Actinomycetota bacterium]